MPCIDSAALDVACCAGLFVSVWLQREMQMDSQTAVRTIQLFEVGCDSMIGSDLVVQNGVSGLCM